MSDLLFLAHRIPYPPNKGDKIRSWNFLRHLAQHRRVHLGCFIDDPADREHISVLRDICGECHFVELQPRLSRLLSARGLLTGAPLTLPYYASFALTSWVRDVVARYRPQQLFFYSSAVAQFDAPTPYPARRVIDFVDVDSQKWAEYADRQRWPLSWVYAREGRTLLRFERETAQRMDASLFVSPAETRLFANLAPECAGKLHPVNNGVDTDYFSPERPYETPFPAGTRALVFTGAMDYWPNIDAVVHFAETVLPRVRNAVPDASFWIVGSNPAPAVSALAARPGVVITGRVPDVRPYLAHAAAVVAPLRIARGIQNKVLEAMAMAKTVIATPQAAEGIEGQDGRDLLVPPTADAFAQATVQVLRAGPSG
ncbi:MAG TPA: TIGR03087 family PEP-CTERM/XrtA system glycosyltransferase, partial [Alphaproteobacteria bacterium]|nr:TIGR03087 family PEP-CTERM/XrtA system glycosyltransferase [Alphaproteobacteria bacterium]